MIIFRNPGIIDLDAIRTMGVSVKLPGSFGYFGTGLKYAIATILRGGGSILIAAPPHEITFRTRDIEVRGQPFKTVQMDVNNAGWHDMGFTDQLGKNWEPWMVLRELGCNALDESGEFWHATEEEAAEYEATGQEWGAADTTTIVVVWSDLDAAFKNKNEIFIDGDAPILTSSSKVEVIDMPASHFFYRGIRAHKLNKPSRATYNILAEQQLTEDRTLANVYSAKSLIRQLWLQETNPFILETLLSAGQQYYEYDLEYHNETFIKPSDEFIKVVLYLRNNRKLREMIAPGAVTTLQKHLRSAEKEFGYTRSHYMEDEFGQVMEALGEIFQNDPLDLDKQKFVMVEELPDDQLALSEDGRMYVRRDLLKMSKNVIAKNILKLILDSWNYDAAQDILIDALLETHAITRTPKTKADEPLILSDDQVPEPSHAELEDEIPF
jgi:hypothetical protein